MDTKKLIENIIEGFDDVLTSTTKDELQAMAKKSKGKDISLQRDGWQ